MAAVALGGFGAFAFEVDVVDEAVEALGGAGERFIPGAHGVRALGGAHHAGEGGAGALCQVLCLEFDMGGEPAAHLVGPAGVICQEGGAGGPGGGAAKEGGDGGAAPGGVGDELGEAFVEGFAAARGEPDEVADAE